MVTLSMTWLARHGVPPRYPESAAGGGATGFILGSDVRPAPKTSHTTESQEPLCPNIFRP